MQKYQTYLLINMIIKVCVKQSTTTSSVLQFNILVFMFDLVFPESPKMFSKYTILCTILFNILYICTYTFNISRKAVFIQTINNFPINEIHLCEFFHNFTISNSNLISSKMNPRAKRLLLFLFSHLVQSSPALYMYIVAAGFRVVGKGRCRVAISCDRIGWSRGHDIIIQVANSTWNLLASGRQCLAPLMTSASLQPTVPGPTSLHPLRC